MSLTLNDKLGVIGFRLSRRNPIRISKKDRLLVDIEQTLIEAAREVPNDSKLFSLMCSWVMVHGDYVITEKLMKKTKSLEKSDAALVWVAALAVFAKSAGFHKWGRLTKKFKSPVMMLDSDLIRSAVALRGAMPNFEEFGILVPVGSIRVRENDALTTEEFALENSQYRNRLLYGACWRADIITAIEAGILTPYGISKFLGCSYEPAHRVHREYFLARPVKGR